MREIENLRGTLPGQEREGQVVGKRFFLLCLAAFLAIPSLSSASSKEIQTPSLIVTDGSGSYTDEQLGNLAKGAQETLEEILALWSADAGLERFGKIRVVFDAPRNENYSSVFFWEAKGDRRVRVVRVHGAKELPQMMAHKLTSAVFPQKDKLIRNMMGILSEVKLGNPGTFPMCGFSCDEWALAFLELGLYLPLEKLGPDHGSWGMEDKGGGDLRAQDFGKQHRAYAEAGSFGHYLSETYGIDRIKRFHRLSVDKARPWQAAFGLSLDELEKNWLEALKSSPTVKPGNVSLLMDLFKQDPETARNKARNLAGNQQ